MKMTKRKINNIVLDLNKKEQSKMAALFLLIRQKTNAVFLFSAPCFFFKNL